MGRPEAKYESWRKKVRILDEVDGDPAAIGKLARQLIEHDLRAIAERLEPGQPLEEKESRRLNRYGIALHHLRYVEEDVAHGPGCQCGSCRRAMQDAEAALERRLAELQDAQGKDTEPAPPDAPRH